MTFEEMQELLESGEKITIEYKECIEGLNSSVFETVSSFSNRYGGYVILGVEDDGTPKGVNRNTVKDIKHNFVNALNNPEKMSPTLYLTLEEFEYDGRLLLWVFVPPSSTVIKCAGLIYDRNEDGDMDITKNPILVENMYRRKSETYIEHKIFPYVTQDNLRMDLMSKVRQLVANKKTDHEWLAMSDMEIMVSAGLYETDFMTGRKGFNMAAVLLFGKDEVIKSCVPGYVTDAIYRVENLDRYDDRLLVSTNLLDSYYWLMGFISKHTSDKFCLIDNESVSIRGLIAREVVGNILVHRDYASAFPAKLIIEKEWIRTENWCKPRRHGRIAADEFTPYPKNPLLASFFVNIGHADTLGSGVRNLFKYTPIYSAGGKPELFEDDVFRISIPLTANANHESELTEREDVILKMIYKNPKLQVEEVMDVLGISRSTVFRDYRGIKEKVGVIYDRKEGKWKIPVS